MLSSFGYTQQGARWVLKRALGPTLALTVCALLFLGIGAGGVEAPPRV